MTLCLNHWLSFNTVVEHIFTLTGATWSSRNVIGPAQFMSYWPSSKGLKHLAHMNKESRANILQSTPDNIFMPQHKNSVLNADVSSKRGSSSQAPVLKNTVSSQVTQGYERTQNSTAAPYFGFISEKTFSGAKRWIDRKIDTNKTSKFTTTDGGWCRWLRYIIYQRASFLSFIKWVSRVFYYFIDQFRCKTEISVTTELLVAVLLLLF